MQRKKIIYIIVIVLFAALLLWVFRNALSSIAGLLLSSFIQAYIFLPFVKSLEKRVPRPAAIILAFVLTGAVNAAVITLLVPVFAGQIKSLATLLPEYISRIEDFISIAGEKVPHIKKFTDKIDINDTAFSVFSEAVANISPGAIISFVSTSLLIPVVVYYFLKDREKIKNMCLFFVPKKMRTGIKYVFRDIDRQMRDYIVGETAIILIVSTLMAAALGIFGFEYWLILGILMGIFNVIPYIGPVLGSVPIVLVALPGGWRRIILALTIITVVQQIDNIIVQPRVISNAVKIHPVIVLVCIIAGNSIGSVTGMVLAVPFYITLRILFKEFYKIFSERKCNFQKMGL